VGSSHLLHPQPLGFTAAGGGDPGPTATWPFIEHSQLALPRGQNGEQDD
jgi:hypothetical protein